MNVSGLWKYDDERKKRIRAEQELVVVKATATQLTHDNDELYRKILRLESEKEKLEKAIEKMKPIVQRQLLLECGLLYTDKEKRVPEK